MSIKDKFYLSGRLKNESKALEYKENFSWNDKEARAKYLKTIVAFANCDGGTIVFGVSDRPRKIIGLRDKSFKDTDESQIERSLLDHFDIPIHLYKDECKIGDKCLGVLIVSRSEEKPIICKKNSIKEILREGFIFYRYNSITTLIRNHDLKKIIEEQKESIIKNILDGIDQVVKHDGKNKISISSPNTNVTKMRISNDPSTNPMNISDEEFKKIYPYEYKDLVEKCKARYKNFSLSQKFHQVKKSVWDDKKYCYIRSVYPGRRRDSDPKFYSKKIFEVFDQNYQKNSIVFQVF